tara:strand:+ start:1904 stop:2101 length:198 start_codon:yes stop_codon:yes gene_type:complete
MLKWMMMRGGGAVAQIFRAVFYSTRTLPACFLLPALSGAGSVYPYGHYYIKVLMTERFNTPHLQQ